ncbi:MAG: ANTAR domain-containing protein [Clostridium sp.]|uniref:ANTAR domain-containing response regulator n=1 Tax=Clostridium sp. TaxID=1506 RepID=UPI002FC58E65
MESYKIIIGDNDIDFLEGLKFKLSGLSHQVIGWDTSGPSILRKIRSLNPDIVIVEANMKGISGFEIGEILEGEGICPCIISFKGEASQYRIALSLKKVKTYLKKPIDYNELDYILSQSVKDFEYILKEEKKRKEKKVIDKAKKMLMDKYSIDEEKAYTYIRKKSMDKKTTMYKISLLLIDLLKN